MKPPVTVGGVDLGRVGWDLALALVRDGDASYLRYQLKNVAGVPDDVAAFVADALEGRIKIRRRRGVRPRLSYVDRQRLKSYYFIMRSGRSHKAAAMQLAQWFHVSKKRIDAIIAAESAKKPGALR